MFKIKGNDIYLTRADSAELSVNLRYADGRQYAIGENDTIIFQMRKERSSVVELSKTFVGTSIVTLEPNDTKDLDFGKYKYEIELVLESGKVYTVIPYADLFLENEIVITHNCVL